MSRRDDHAREAAEVSIAEIAELTARLRRLSDAGRRADVDERARFLADKRDLLDRIAAEQADRRRSADHDGGPGAPPEPDPEIHDHRAALRPAPDPESLPAPPWLADAEAHRAEPLRLDDPAEVAARLADLRARAGDQAVEQQRRDQLARWHADDQHTDRAATDDGWER